MKLADVIDLEIQLALDEEADPSALHARDRAVYLALKPRPATPEATLLGWLSALRARFGGPQLGARLAHGRRLLGYGLGLTAIACGWGAAEVLLHFEEGASPINVGHYLLVLVFAQLLSLLLLLAGLALRRAFPAWPVLSDLQRWMRYLAMRLSLRDHARAPVDAQAERVMAAFHRVRGRAGLYSQLERYHLLSLGQLFGVMFNLGVLASGLRLVLLSDLAFAWSTSVASLDAAAVHRLTSLLSLPFGLIVPDAVPSLSLIEQTQYFRFEGRFAGATGSARGNAALAGQWWRFLMACTVCYGLLPRALLLAYFRLRLWRSEHRVPLDTPQVQRVLRRLHTPHVSTRPADGLAREGAEPARPVEASAWRATETALIVYRDVPTASHVLTAAVCESLGLTVTGVYRAGGLDRAADDRLCAELAGQADAATIVAEAWEAPDKSLRGFLAALRSAMGPRRSLLVALVGPASEQGFVPAEPQDVRVFRDRLTLLEDPYLAVEVLTPPGDARTAGSAEAR